LDLTYTVPTPDLSRVKQDYGAELQTASILGTLYLALNLTEPPFRDSRDLRQALSMTVDRDFIAEHETLGVTPAYSFVPRGVRDYQPAVCAWSDWARDRRLRFAQNLYARAGYSKAHPLHLKLLSTAARAVDGSRLRSPAAGNRPSASSAR
jgi:oligopeptide transport system substrate-binding protein